MKPNWQNDLELTTYIMEAHKWHGHLSRQTRDKLDGALFLTAMQLETAARKIQERLNELRYGKDFVPPVEQMGT